MAVSPAVAVALVAEEVADHGDFNRRFSIKLIFVLKYFRNLTTNNTDYHFCRVNECKLDLLRPILVKNLRNK